MKTKRRKTERVNNVWYVNNSSLDLLQTCPRKFEYVNKSTTESEHPALVFGSAIHKALEEFYKTLPTDRTHTAMIRAFEESLEASSTKLPETSKDARDGRSVENGIKIINNYFDLYRGSPLVAIEDSNGFFVEREFEVQLRHNIHLFGTIDLVCKDTSNGDILIVDHKTTKTIGNAVSHDWNRSKPNHQLTGYYYAAQAMGLNPNMVMLNILQVAKTVHSSIQVSSNRTQEDLNEWEYWVASMVGQMERYDDAGHFPMNGSSQCYQMGGCKFAPVCASPKNIRSDLIDLMNKKEEEL
jgi:hypothetical protein